MKRTFAAALFALLAVTAPAHAAVLAIEDLRLNFGDGYAEDGSVGILTNGFFVGPSTLTFSFNGTPLDISASFDSVPGHLCFWHQPNPSPFIITYFCPSAASVRVRPCISRKLA